MELTLSKKSPANAVLSDFQGQPQYRISTPFAFFGRTTAIHRVTGHQAGRPRYHHKKPYSGEEELAKIRWNYYCRRTKLQYNGWNLDFHTFMPSQKGLFKHTRHRLVGPDGRTYEWHMKKSCYLDTKDWSGATIPIARLHPSSFWKCKKARLEIFPAGMHMVDLIVITFVYVQQKQQNKGRSANQLSATMHLTAAAGGGGGGGC